MDFHRKLSMEYLPWKFQGSFSAEFHVGKDTKTPRRLVPR